MVFLSERFFSSNTNSNTENNAINKEEESKEKEKQKQKYFNIIGHIIYTHNNIRRELTKPSFGTKEKDLFNLIKNDTPGPGKYNILKNLKKISANKRKNISFLINSPRFENMNHESEFLPGPGSYNLSDCNVKLLLNKPINHKKFKNLKRNNFGSLNNINSIPVKQHFGYFEDEEGKLTQIKDLNVEETNIEEKEKNNSVKYDKYKIIMKNQNPIVKWDKMSTRNLSPNNNKNENSENIIQNLSKMSELDNDISVKNKNNYIDIFKNYRSKIIPKQLKLLSDIQKKNKNQDNILYKEGESFFIDKDDKNLIKNKISKIKIEKYNEKGNIYPINFSQIKRHPRHKEEFIFGSSLKRDLKDINNSQTLSPGPGAYFNDTYKLYFIKRKNIKNRNKKNIDTNKNENQKNNKSVSSLSLLGPCSYNIIKNTFDKKSYNSIGSFSNEKRFYDYSDNKDMKNEENITPGPGQYDFEIKYPKNFKKKIFIQKFVNSEIELKKIRNKRMKKINNDFNNYQSNSIINLIQSKIKRNINPYSSKRNPFLSGQARFSYKEIKNNKNLGPGKYNIKDDSLNKNIYNHAAFNSNQPREIYFSNIINNSNEDLSPASYQLNNYYSWDKKSFNIMFI